MEIRDESLLAQRVIEGKVSERVCGTGSFPKKRTFYVFQQNVKTFSKVYSAFRRKYFCRKHFPQLRSPLKENVAEGTRRIWGGVGGDHDYTYVVKNNLAVNWQLGHY